MAGLILGAVGAFIAPVGYAGLGFSIGSAIGNLLFPRGGEDTHQEGPRLGDLKAQSSAYGVPIPICYGSIRIAGNVIWAADILETTHTETHESGGKGGGGSSSTTTTYTYSQSFAVGLCEGPITGVRRIWANGKLIYNLSATADAGTIAASNASSTKIKFFTGTETQAPSSLIQAYVGASNAPAYKSLAYVVFESLQLADFGNRTPNLEFEVVKAASLTYTISLFPTIPNNSPSYSYGDGSANREGTLLYNVGISSIKLWSTPVGNAPFLKATFALPSTPSFVRLNETGTRLIYWDLAFNLSIAVTNNGGDLALQGTKPLSFSNPYFATTKGDNLYIFYGGGYLEKWSGVEGGELVLLVRTKPNVFPPVGDMIAVGDYLYNVDYTLSLLRVFSAGDLSLLSSTPLTGGNCLAASNDGLLLFTASISGSGGAMSSWSLNDPVNPALLDTLAGLATRPLNCVLSGNYFLFGGAYTTKWFVAVDVSDPNALRLVAQQQIDVDPTTNGIRAISTNGGYVTLLTNVTNNVVSLFFADGLITNSTSSLSSIVTDICSKGGLSAGEIDVTTLINDNVDGYVVYRGTPRGWLEPLMQAFFFDAVESDGKVKFVKRGLAPAVTIVENDLAAHEFGAETPDPILKTRKQEIELPSECEIKYLDTSAAYLPGTQASKRAVTTAKNVLSLSFAIAMTANKAKQIADVILYEAWAGRTSVEFSSSFKYSFLDPTDVVTLVRENVPHIVRLTESNATGGLFKRQAVLEDISVYTQTTAGAAMPVSSDKVLLKVPTLLLFLDISLLRDQDDGAGFYIVAGGIASGWRGAQVFKSMDNGASWESFGSPILGESSIGTANNVLSNFAAGTVFDELNQVTVTLVSGSLSSVTRTNVLNGKNVALLGDEIIQFRNATLISDKKYVLSGLLRGIRGTEWAMPLHVAGERFVLLDAATTRLGSGPSSEYGLERLYRGVTFGLFLDDTSNTAFSNRANALLPYAPVHLGGGRNAALDVILKWTRRTRIAGAWNNYADVPLGETAELYVVRIYETSAYATVKRTLTGPITSPTATYSVANQITDFGSAQATIYWSVCQVSSTIGNGREAKGIT